MEHNRQPDGFWKGFSILLLAVLVGLVGYLFYQQGRNKPVFYQSSPSFKSSLASLTSTPPAGDDIYWVADLAEQTMPFVVNIQTKIAPSKQAATSAAESQRNQELMQQMQQMLPFGGEGFDMRQFQEQQNEERIAGEGSGFIIREDGYVVTNSHVVQGADTFTVRMSNGKEHEAELVGTDNYKDIAVLKIKSSEKFPVAVLGTSASTRIGEPVVAIGSPLGLKASVTSGIISTNDRSLSDLGRPQDVRRPQKYLQTDAAINRGNSGGPLLNSHGEVIGVNQAIARWDSSPSANNEFGMVPIEGIGFAIPIDEVKGTIDQIVRNGKVVYPGISAEITSVEAFKAENKRRGTEVKFHVDKGVYVSRVTVGGPAARAGIEANDVILSINGTEVTTAEGLITEINKFKVGDRVKLRVARQGGETLEDVGVVLGELDLSGIAPGE